MKRHVVQIIIAGAIAGATLGSFAQRAAAGEPDAKTVRLWKSKCASCHGPDGKGQTEQGLKLGLPNMADPVWQKSVKDEDMKKSLNEGKKSQKDPKEGMEAFKDKLTPEQMEALLAYVRTFK